MRYLRTETLSPEVLESYPGNARTHDESALDESARVNGQYRSIVARYLPDGTYQILAGHGTVLAFERAGAETVRVEVIDADDTEARRIVLADNATSRNAGYDERLLLDLLDQASGDGGLLGTGWGEDAYRQLLDADALLDDDDAEGSPDGDSYTDAVNVPQYEIVGPEPALSELRDEARADELRAAVRAADLPADLREYLLAAAGRHTVFNYRKAAEFYPHATPEVQSLMEASALVIIDVDDAIRLGYAQLSARLVDLQQRDAGAGAE